MNFKKLSPSLFAFVLAIAPALAQTQNITDTRSAVVETLTQKPSYRQWKTYNFIDKIEYRQNEMVIFYRYTNDNGAFIYAPRTENGWLLKDNKGNTHHAKAIKNVKDGNKLVAELVTSSVYIPLNLDYNAPTRDMVTVTCEIHFDLLPADINKVDLIEGELYEKEEERFHTFDIQIQQPKKLKADEVIVQNLEMIPYVEEVQNEYLGGMSNREYLDAGYELIYRYDENGGLVLDENGEPIVEDIIFPPPSESEPDFEDNFTFNTGAGSTYEDNFTFEDTPSFEEEYAFGDADEYQEPLEILAPAFELSKKIKTDKNPKVRQWQKDYNITRIEYHKKEMVITFQKTSEDHISSIFYGPEGEHPWFLRDKDGNVYPMKALNSLIHNGQVKAEGISTQVRLSSDWEDNRKEHVATCQIVFDRLPAGVKVVDLIEGTGRETWSNHFNVFDIEIKQFETKVEPGTEPTAKPAEVEPIVVDAVERPNGIEQVASSSNYTLFPNPNRGTFFLTNNGKTQNDATVQVLDLAGKLIYTQNAVALQEKNSQSFQVANLPAGQYTIRIQHSDKTVESLKMIVVE